MQGNTRAHISRQLIIQDHVGILRSLVINEKIFVRTLNIVALFLKKKSLYDHFYKYCLLNLSVKGAALYSTSEQNLVLCIKFPIPEQFKLKIFIEKIRTEKWFCSLYYRRNQYNHQFFLNSSSSYVFLGEC